MMKNKIGFREGWTTTLIAVGCCTVLLWGTIISPLKVEKCKLLRRFELSEVKFNTPIVLLFYSHSQADASQAGRDVFTSIDKLENIFTDYRLESELRRLCANSDGKTPIKVSDPLFLVLDRAKQVSQSSQGAFDVTIGPVVKLWRRAIRKQELPAPELLAEARSKVGYQMIHLNPQDRTVLLEKPDMRLDLGGIAKGYIIDQALAVLREHGIDRALVDIGGDIGLGSPPPGKTGWTVAIAPLEKRGLAPFSTPQEPIHPKNSTQKKVPDPFFPYCRVTLANCAVATSGDTERFVEIDGRRYSHLIDPRTGVGITDHSNVTVIAPDALTADALASAVSILGPSEGLKLIEETPNAETLILRRPGERFEVYRSAGFPKE